MQNKGEAPLSRGTERQVLPEWRSALRTNKTLIYISLCHGNLLGKYFRETTCDTLEYKGLLGECSAKCKV